MRVPRKTADEAKALAAKLPGITAGQVLAEAHDLQLLVVAALHELGAVGSDGLNLTAHRLLESHTEAVLTRRRDLIVSGESLHVIDVGTDGLKLLPVGDHDVSGTSPDPSEWIYRVSLHGPDASVSRSIPAAGVVHIRYSADPARPWRGVGPLRRAGLDAELLSSLLTRLKEESGAPVAHVIPSPADGQADSTATLRADLKAAGGGVVMAETQMGGYGDKAASPMQDWAVRRIGANPPDVLRALASETGARIMKACSVPSALLTASADGTSQRESLRRWVHCHVAPLGRICAAELADKLNLPGLSMGFEALYGSDIVGRASAFKRLTEAGISVEKAASISGLVAADE